MIRLIALDIDGTLLNSEGRVSEGTTLALLAARERGCTLVLATGRAFHSMSEVLDEADYVDYAVSSGGSGIFDRAGNMLFSSKMPPELSRKVSDSLDGLGLTPEIYIRGQAYASNSQLSRLESWGVPERVRRYILRTRIGLGDLRSFMEENINNIEGMDVLLAPRDMRTAIRSALDAIDGLSVTSSSDHYADLNTPYITKASGLSRLGALLGIDKSEMMAFGDAENDCDMLRFAGIGVAMGNCIPLLQPFADYITDTNNADGIAKALRKFEII